MRRWWREKASPVLWLVGVLIIPAFAVIVLSGCSAPQSFEDACAYRGGFVISRSTGFMSGNFECIVDNQTVYLPGFA